MSVAWPDIIIGAVLVIGGLKGFKRGFIGELTGFVALACGVVAAFAYPGSWDEAVKNVTHLGPGSTHVVAMVLFGAIVYGAVFAAGWLLGRVAKLPVIGQGNALLGAGVGVLKAAIFVWAIVYIGLFFPLSPDLRGDLHQSRFIAILQTPDDKLDGVLRSSLPWFVQPFAGSMFARHRV